MTTVVQMLDRLAAGTVTLDEVARDFSLRDWPDRRRATLAQAHGVVDDYPVDDNSWQVVETDSRLSAAQFRRLSAAFEAARRAR